MAVVTLVIRSSRRCGRIRPVRRSTTPPGVLSAQTSASHSSAVDACFGRTRDFSDAAHGAELASLAASRGCPPFQRRLAADADGSDVVVEHLIRIPAHASPDQPLAPKRAVAPVLGIAAGEGQDSQSSVVQSDAVASCGGVSSTERVTASARRRRGSPTSKPSLMASAASQPSGLSSGGSRMATVVAPRQDRLRCRSA